MKLNSDRNSLSGPISRVIVAVVLISSPPLVPAHHAPALYDSDSMMAVEGTLVAYEHRFPHARILLDVGDEDGAVTRWTISMPPPQAIERKGHTERLKGLEAGTPVRIRGWPHFVNENEIRSYKVYLENDEMLQMVYNNDFKHKDQVRIEVLLSSPGELGPGSAVDVSPRERVGQWVSEDDYIRRVAIEYNAGQAVFVGVVNGGITGYPGIEDHLACLPERIDSIELDEAFASWWQSERVANYIREYNDMLARHLETSLVTCGV